MFYKILFLLQLREEINEKLSNCSTNSVAGVGNPMCHKEEIGPSNFHHTEEVTGNTILEDSSKLTQEGKRNPG